MYFRVAIIGCGLIGNKRALSIERVFESASVSPCKIVQFCDLDLCRARALASRHQADAGSDWEQTVQRSDLDIVVVATVNMHLAPIAIAALRSGKHVLCEKPLGRNFVEAGQIVLAAQESGCTLKTGFNYRHHPAIAKAKSLADSGELGRLHFLRCRFGHGGRPGYDKEWRADRELCGGGELLDQGVHVVDLFRWFMGDFEEAFGYVSTVFWNMPVEDNAFALFRTGDRRIASMHTSWTQWKNIFSFEVFGELGYLVVDGLGGSYGPETLTIGKRRTSVDLEGRMEFTGGAPKEEKVMFCGPDLSWDAEWLEFISAIEHGREPVGSGWDGLEANRMLEAVYLSASKRCPVQISKEVV
jgi:predicted dehydrogenase